MLYLHCSDAAMALQFVQNGSLSQKKATVLCLNHESLHTSTLITNLWAWFVGVASNMTRVYGRGRWVWPWSRKGLRKSWSLCKLKLRRATQRNITQRENKINVVERGSDDRVGLDMTAITHSGVARTQHLMDLQSIMATQARKHLASDDGSTVLALLKHCLPTILLQGGRTTSRAEVCC